MSWKKKFELAKGKTSLLGHAAREKANEAMDQHWGLIQDLWREKVDPSVRSVVMDDEKLKSCLRVVRNALPLPIRFAIKEETFIRICLNNRNRWLPPEESDTANEQASETETKKLDDT